MPGTVEPDASAPTAATAAAAPADIPSVELPVDDTPPRQYVVFNQNVYLDIDFRNKSIQGRSDIMLVPTGPDAPENTEVFIDARQCDIDVKKITVSNCDVEASYKDPCDWVRTPDNFRWSAPQWGIRKHRMMPLLHHRRKEVSALKHDLQVCTPIDGSIRVRLPSAEEVKRKNRDSLKSDQQDLLLHSDGTVGGYRISIPFKLRNVHDGLHFAGVDEADARYPHVYTRHSIEPGTASSIFPCIDDPGSRNSWKISITCPRTLGDAFHQALATQQQYKDPDAINDSRKRKRGDDEPRRQPFALTEEDKLLEMTVVCSGYLTGEVINKDDETKKTMTFEVDKNKAAKHIGFAVGPFEHVDLWSEFRSEEDDSRLGVSAVKVHGYCLPGRVEEVRNTCAALVTAIDYFVLHFGRYPFESYKVCFVDDMVEDTVPLCAFSLCSTRLLYTQDIIDNEVDTTRTLVHSLASQWFGVNIIPDTKSDIWLVVGIAWYMTEHFMKQLCGNNEFRFRMKTMSDRLVETDIKRPSLQDLGEHLYLGGFEVDFMNLKAPLVLFILNTRLSKSSGSAGIPRIIGRMVSKANTSGQASDEVLGSDPFRRACEKVGNTRLESFWNQWVTGAGCPRFDVFQRFNKKRLCVEMTIRQIQDIAAAKPRPLDKNDFWRDVLEETHAVYAGELQNMFTGPMTIRIHEADGTPYEHIVEIRDENAKSTKFEIPYNTKYKRLKRNRRQRERALASNNAKGGDESYKDLYYLGDVLQHPDDVEKWDFRDWDEETEGKMDQESYEWIRMDADFEWICEMQVNLPAYMYASQLQQDRDVAAQQDSMLFLHRNFNKSGPHPLVSTILTRTLLDPRYYYGIRVMAAEELPRHAAQGQVDWIGMRHLLKAFQHFFCYPGTYTPRPNNFSDKRQYLVQRAIPQAVACVRGDDGNCPKEARRFLLEQLQANNNEDNVYSDQLYVCGLIKALATCQIPDEKKAKKQARPFRVFNDDDDEEMQEIDTEPEEFRKMALEEIERYRRMDEYSPSYQNCFTVAALDALCRLMKAKVMPTDNLLFVQYLQDRTCDVVRIKACESLVELDLLASPPFLRFFLSLVGTDPSPFVRDQLFKILCRGLASIAIGENADSGKQTPPADGDLIVVEQDSAVIDARQKAKARKEDLTAALAALKEETTDDEDLQEAIWNVMNSPILSVAERINILELCSILVEEDQSLLVVMKYPTYWTMERGERSRHRYMVKFKRHYRTRPRKPFAPPLPPKPEPKRTITLNLNRNGSFSTKAGSTPVVTAAASQAPATSATPKSSGTVTAPRPPVQAPKQAPAPLKPSVAFPKSRASTPAGSQEKPAKVPLPKARASTPAGSHERPAKVAVPKDRAATPASSLERPSKFDVAKRSSTPASLQGKPLKVALAKARASTPAGSQEKPVKNGGSHRDSISVQAPVRQTIELSQSEAKAAPPKVNGNGRLALSKFPRPPKRASTESTGGRPNKIIKLNTSGIKPSKLGFLQTPKSASKPKKIVRLPFKAWDKLKLRKDASGAASIRATPKGSQAEKASVSTQQSTLKSSPPTAATGPGPISSSPTMSSSQASTDPTSVSQTQALSQSSGSNKPRKALPGMRKPLPSGAHTASTPTKPSSASPPATKKLKIKLKPQQ